MCTKCAFYFQDGEVTVSSNGQESDRTTHLPGVQTSPKSKKGIPTNVQKTKTPGKKIPVTSPIADYNNMNRKDISDGDRSSEIEPDSRQSDTDEDAVESYDESAEIESENESAKDDSDSEAGRDESGKNESDAESIGRDSENELSKRQSDSESERSGSDNESVGSESESESVTESQPKSYEKEKESKFGIVPEAQESADTDSEHERESSMLDEETLPRVVKIARAGKTPKECLGGDKRTSFTAGEIEANMDETKEPPKMAVSESPRKSPQAKLPRRAPQPKASGLILDRSPPTPHRVCSPLAQDLRNLVAAEEQEKANERKIEEEIQGEMGERSGSQANEVITVNGIEIVELRVINTLSRNRATDTTKPGSGDTATHNSNAKVQTRRSARKSEGVIAPSTASSHILSKMIQEKSDVSESDVYSFVGSGDESPLPVLKTYTRRLRRKSLPPRVVEESEKWNAVIGIKQDDETTVKSTGSCRSSSDVTKEMLLKKGQKEKRIKETLQQEHLVSPGTAKEKVSEGIDTVQSVCMQTLSEETNTDGEDRKPDMETPSKRKRRVSESREQPMKVDTSQSTRRSRRLSEKVTDILASHESKASGTPLAARSSRRLSASSPSVPTIIRRSRRLSEISASSNYDSPHTAPSTPSKIKSAKDVKQRGSVGLKVETPSGQAEEDMAKERRATKSQEHPPCARGKAGMETPQKRQTMETPQKSKTMETRQKKKNMGAVESSGLHPEKKTRLIDDSDHSPETPSKRARRVCELTPTVGKLEHRQTRLLASKGEGVLTSPKSKVSRSTYNLVVPFLGKYRFDLLN